MPFLPLFKMPTPMKITGRSSSITNAFVNSIIPVVAPTEDQVEEAFSILEMTIETFQCSYCGDTASEWDHFRPLIVDKAPTGFISEIHNLVPSCGKCNQSKGNKNWRDWMLSDAPLSPKMRKIHNIEARIGRLENYEKWGEPTKIDFEGTIGRDLWEAHWKNCEEIQEQMRKAQVHAEKIKEKIIPSSRATKM